MGLFSIFKNPIVAGIAGFALGGVGGAAFALQMSGAEQKARAAKDAAKVQRENLAEQAAAAGRQREIAQIQRDQEKRQLDEERQRQLGSIQARLGASGISTSAGSAAILQAVTEQRFREAEEEGDEIFELEVAGFNSQIEGLNRARSRVKSGAGDIRLEGLINAGYGAYQRSQI